MVYWSESRHVSGHLNNAALSAIRGISELSYFCPDSSFSCHPISLAFSGNPLFPLASERHMTYFKGSCASFRALSLIVRRGT